MIDRIIRLLERLPHSNGGRNYARALRTWSWLRGDLVLTLLREPRDLWIGWYWDVEIVGEFVQYGVLVAKAGWQHGWGYRSRHSSCRRYSLYFVALPTLVLRLRWTDRREIKRAIAAQPQQMYLTARQGYALAETLRLDYNERRAADIKRWDAEEARRSNIARARKGR